ncbi:hypothetical protein F4776DRAFT_668335 [Hypoxylon sp. NC0597]|nr:hypothetical protein F4776DRAFT_668335 [Hypoxylon sp. NC0597]
MDPISALSVASAAITFLDFACGLVGGAIDIYRSPDGTIDDNAHIKVINHLKKVSKALDAKFQGDTDAEKQIKQIVESCKAESAEIVASLESFRVQPGRWKFWRSLEKSWKKWRTSVDVQKSRDRLQQYRAEIMLHLLAMLQDEQSGFSSQLRSIKNSCEDLGIEYPKQLNSLREDLINAIQAGDQRTDQILILLRGIRENSSAIPLQHRVLRQLVFKGIHSRTDSYENPTKAIDDELITYLEDKKVPFENLRNETRERFLAWLRCGYNVFHISGKAGSGKSTLMKFLARHERTREELQKWAGDKKLVLADFYFWNPGKKLQMTLPGLHRSILFEVLSRCPELTQEVFRSQWKRLNETHGDPIVESNIFGDDSIEDAFNVLVQMKQHSHHRFCFFIDGLDECDGNVLDHEELARKLKSWTKGRDVKICASSRPYQEFLELLATPENTTIHLHLLNEFDILVDCLNHFSKDRAVRETKLRYTDLIEQIAVSSRGVFLWAHLVVGVILTGVRQRDPLDVLHKKLEEIPEELDDLYAKLREPVERSKVDTKRSNKMLLLATKCPDGYLDAIAFSWLDKTDPSGGDLEDPEFPYVNEVCPYSEDDTIKRVRNVEKQINTLARGFLELSPASEPPKGNLFQPWFNRHVRFSHRTARDFFLGSKDRMARLEESFEHFSESHPYARLLIAKLIFGLKDLHSDLYTEFLRELILLVDMNMVIVPRLQAVIQLLRPDILFSIILVPNKSIGHTPTEFYLSMMGVEVEGLRQEVHHPHRLLRELDRKNWQGAALLIERNFDLDHPIRVTIDEKVVELPLWTIAATLVVHHQMSNHDYGGDASRIARLLCQHAIVNGEAGDFKLSLTFFLPALRYNIGRAESLTLRRL